MKPLLVNSVCLLQIFSHVCILSIHSIINAIKLCNPKFVKMYENHFWPIYGYYVLPHILAASFISVQGLRVYLCLHSLFDPLIRDQRSGLRLMKSCVSGSKLVDWLVEEGFVQGRDEAVEFCSLLMTVGILKHGQLFIILV